jgi:peptide chain release factor 2
VQRVPETESSGRIHTSAATVAVLPEVDDVEVEINPNDVKVDVYRASGNGGQCVNTTDSAVRMTHLPTGIVVTCQNERSQFQNKDMAMRILKARLMERAEEERKANIKELKGDMGMGTWGNQIRSYVFQPYTMVKDHRTQYEVSNVNAVMDGEIEGFINAKLQQKDEEN